MKKLFMVCSLVVALVGFMAFNAGATPIFGDISLSGNTAFDNPNLNIATMFTSFNLVAVDSVFGDDVDYAMLNKIYGSDPVGEKRYSPAICIGAERRIVTGSPNKEHISTSFAERQNLTMRMHMRRFTRLTNAFSKKWENLWAAYCLHFAYYNFCRIHRTIRVTPAMEAGITDHVWETRELLA